MPELPEVETVVQDLNDAMRTRVLQRLEILDPSLLKTHDFTLQRLVGKRIDAIWRRGKYIVYDIDSVHVIQHLRMTGKMLRDDSTAIPPVVLPIGSNLQIRSVWRFADGADYVFYDVRRFGTLDFVTSVDDYFQQRKLAPDAVSHTDDARTHFVMRCKKAAKPIKSCLLDQQIACGVGNIYADEALHRVGIHPLRRARALPATALVSIFDAAVAVMQWALAKRGTSMSDYLDVNGNPGVFKKYLFVYGRYGDTCKTCESAEVEFIVIAGRRSHYCPVCQPYRSGIAGRRRIKHHI